MTKKYFEIENLLVKAAEMYEYNLQQYPEENPTMIGAIEEILYEIKKEKGEIWVNFILRKKI